MEDLKTKLKSKIIINNSGCWIWQGELHQGYGRLRYQKKRMRAHRASYMAFKGELPDDMFVCHSCDVPACINPDHLWLGTHRDNMDDAIAKGRIPMKVNRPPAPRGPRRPRQGTQHWKARLTEADVLEIRKIYAEGLATQKELADKFNTSERYISFIITRYRWKHI